MTIEQRLVKAYGTTEYPQLAVWMLRDGTYVNGSYEGHQRDVDHHEISAFYKPSKKQQPGCYACYVYKFMNRGNIRVGCTESGWCYEMTRKPSREQANQLFDAILMASGQGTHAYFGRYGKTACNPTWTDAFKFLEYINRYTDYYPPMKLQDYYFEWTGKELINYGW